MTRITACPEKMEVIQEADTLPLQEVPDTKALTDSYTNLSDFQDAMRQYGNYHYYPVPLDDSLHFYNANHLNQRGVEIYDAFIIDTLIVPTLESL